MKLKFFAFGMSFLLCAASYASDKEAPYNFHGIQLGTSEKNVLEQQPEFECKEDGPVRRCSGYMRFSSQPGILSNNGATNVALVFAEDKLVNIHVMWIPAVFETTHKKFEEELGQPINRELQKIKTSDGKIYENSITQWHNGVSTVQYEKYWQDIGVSRILYMLK